LSIVQNAIMPKYIIKTLGCKVNQYESESLSDDLEKSGFKPSLHETPDICIINTCTVTSRASMQSRQAIRHAIRTYPNARIVVTGCYAQTEPDTLQRIDGIHQIIQNAEKHRLTEIITSPCENLKNKFQCGETVHRSDISIFQPSPPVSGYRTRPFLKIQDGCDAFCTYCIVPYARGQSRSMPFETVLEHIRSLEKSGSIEIVLTGIHLGAFGQDLKPRRSLYDLLNALEKENAVKRVRLSSIEPHELSGDIIRLASSSNMLCNHFHIPLQSGNDAVLKKMNRPYTRSFFRDLLKTIHESIPSGAMGVDVIIGFPGETDEAFNDTYSLISELPISYLHVFPFSPRRGTPAAKFKGRVASSVIKERSKIMRELGNQKKSDFYNRFIGKTADVLVESTRDKKTGYLKGFSSNYIPVLIEGTDALKNSLVCVKLEKMNKDMRMIGKIQ